MQPLIIHPRRSDEPTAIIEAIYQLADALKAADKALDGVPLCRSDLDALLDKPLYLGDMHALSKTIRTIADAWQNEIDIAEMAAAVAEDERRDNPLEPDFRRLGQ